MRPIKFRAWNKKSRTMVYLFGITEKEVLGRGATAVYASPVENNELMQFTGLLDKSGKEIYEGDLLRWNSNNTFIVCWNESNASFEPVGPRDLRWFMKLANSAEVVGNRFDNPELVK